MNRSCTRSVSSQSSNRSRPEVASDRSNGPAMAQLAVPKGAGSPGGGAWEPLPAHRMLKLPAAARYPVRPHWTSGAPSPWLTSHGDSGQLSSNPSDSSRTSSLTTGRSDDGAASIWTAPTTGRSPAPAAAAARSASIARVTSAGTRRSFMESSSRYEPRISRR